MIGPAGSTLSTASINPQAESPRIAKAMAAMTGQPLPEAQQEPKADLNVKKIQMKTNVTPPQINVAPELAQEAESDTLESTEIEPTQDLEAKKALSPQYAALAKARRAAQAKEAAIMQREQALAKQEADMRSAVEKLGRLKSNPLSVLQEEGITYDQLTEAILNGNTSNPEIDSLKNELKTMKQELLNAQTQRDQAQEQQALKQLNREVESLVAQGDDFETIREAGYAPKVVELIHRMFKETGEIMDTAEAAKLVEEELISEAMQYAKLKKVQSRLNPAPSEQHPLQPQMKNKSLKTLTNRIGSTAPMSARERAIAAFYGQLK